MNNRPITSRVKSGMFKTKEPLLNVGPAGVDGNNKTRTMPSPSKMKGYAMKSSPFKQQVVYEVTKDGTLTAKKTTKETTPAVADTNGKPGQDAKPAIYDTGKSLKGLSQEQLDWRSNEIKKLGGIDNYHIKYGDKTTGKKVKDAVPAVAATPPADGKDEKTKVFEQKADPMRKVEGEASTAYESRNNLRRMKQAARKQKRATIKEGRLDAKLKGLEDGAKKRRLTAKKDQATANKGAAAGEVTSAQAQIDQGKTGFSDSKSYRLKDVKKTPGDVLDDSKLVDGADKKEITENPTGQPMKTNGFFKKKSPMKMNYFKK